jgi:regulation of enolase protein 1 (concanavalin A-like superfamily)
MAYISGTIFDLSDNQPLADVGVWIESFATGSYGETISDGAGFYLIEPLDAGPGYFLAAKRDDYSRRVFEDGVIPYYGLEQDIGMVRTGAVSGNVIESVYGQPVSGVNISFSQLDDPPWGGGETVTDASGNFYIDTLDVSSLTNVSGSNYGVLVVPPGYSYIEDAGFIPPHYTSEDVVLANYIVQPRAVIVGTVTSNGAPLSGAKAYIYDTSTDLLLDDGVVETDAAGNFTMSVNAPATYSMVILGEATSTANVEISIAPGDIKSVSANLAGPGFVSGTVVDLEGNPIEGAFVEILSSAGEDIAADSATTNSEGYYRISVAPSNGPDDNYLIDAILPASQLYTQFPSVAGVNVTSGDEITVDIQGDTISPTIEIVSPTSGDTVSGNVTIVVEGNDNQSLGVVALSVDGEPMGNFSLGTSFNVLSDELLTLDILNPPDSYNISDELPGWLSVHAAIGSNFSQTQDSGHLFYLLLAGDLEIQTQLSANIIVSGLAAGLMLRQDSDNWLMLVHQYDSEPQLSLIKKFEGTVSELATVSMADDLLELKMERSGGNIIAQYRDTDGSWIELASETDFLADNVLAGLAVMAGDNSGFVAEFKMLFVPQTKFFFEWDSTTVDNGNHTLTVDAYDMAGNNTSSNVSVDVEN